MPVLKRAWMLPERSLGPSNAAPTEPRYATARKAEPVGAFPKQGVSASQAQ